MRASDQPKTMVRVITPDVNLSIVFTELPLLERPAAAAQQGFVAAELWWPFGRSTPSQRQLSDLSEAFEDAKLRLAAINFDEGDTAIGDCGTFSVPSHQARLRDNVELVVEFAAPLGCRAFNALYGNRLEGMDPLAQDKLATDNLSYAAMVAQRIGGVVLVETQNIADSPRYPLTRAADVAAVIDRVRHASGLDNVELLADLYHLHRTGEDLPTTIREFAAKIGHVQIADHPGRHQPGTGNIDFGPALSALRSAGYDGYLGLEYRPLGLSAESFDWLTSHPWSEGVSWDGR